VNRGSQCWWVGLGGGGDDGVCVASKPEVLSPIAVLAGTPAAILSGGLILISVLNLRRQYG